MITEAQKEKMRHFLTRPKMFVTDTGKWQVVAFIDGFEFAADNRVFTNEISAYFEANYNIFGSNLGWPNSVQIFADKSSIEWFESFKIAMEFIINNK